MGKIHQEIPVKLICGFIFSEEEFFRKSVSALFRKFGKTDFESSPIGFNFTSYYEAELGTCLKRRFVSFKRLVSPAKLPAIKRFTNRLERKFSGEGKRKINIDPGYVNFSKLVLATTKDYSHRIYLSQGIFAEVTLVFRANSFCACQWTYPDYQTQSYINIFNQIREGYLKQIKKNDI